MAWGSKVMKTIEELVDEFIGVIEQLEAVVEYHLECSDKKTAEAQASQDEADWHAAQAEKAKQVVAQVKAAVAPKTPPVTTAPTRKFKEKFKPSPRTPYRPEVGEIEKDVQKES